MVLGIAAQLVDRVVEMAREEKQKIITHLSFRRVEKTAHYTLM